jgi:hypothetical protein
VMNAVAVQTSIYTLIREQLDGNEVDPHVIAQNMIAVMSEEDMRAALIVALPDTIRGVIRGQRARAGANVGSERWGRVAGLQASGELALLRSRVFACGAWKFLGDCSRDDVADLAEQRAEEAKANAAASELFRRLRVSMGRYRVVVVRDLPGHVLNEVFDA